MPSEVVCIFDLHRTFYDKLQFAAATWKFHCTIHGLSCS